MFEGDTNRVKKFVANSYTEWREGGKFFAPGISPALLSPCALSVPLASHTVRAAGRAGSTRRPRWRTRGTWWAGWFRTWSQGECLGCHCALLASATRSIPVSVDLSWAGGANPFPQVLLPVPLAGTWRWWPFSPPACLVFVLWTVSFLQVSAHLTHVCIPSPPPLPELVAHRNCSVCVQTLRRAIPRSTLPVLPRAALPELVTSFLSSLECFTSKPSLLPPKILTPSKFSLRSEPSSSASCSPSVAGAGRSLRACGA